MIEPPARPAPGKKPRKPRWAFSVRSMLLLVLAIGLGLGWWARTAHLQRASSRRIDDLDAAVIYDHEVLDEGRATPAAERRVFLARLGAGATVTIPRPAPSKVRPAEPCREWVRGNLGIDYSDAVTQVLAEHSAKIRDDDLAILAGFPKLEQLNLGETSIGDAGLVHLAGLRRIKALHLDSTRVTDAGLAHLEPLDQLETLSLGGNGGAITDLGLARLKSLGRLRRLEVGGPRITDAGLDQLRALKDLRRLDLIETPNVTDEGLARLRSALPKLEVVRHTRRRARSDTPARVGPKSPRRPSPFVR